LKIKQILFLGLLLAVVSIGPILAGSLRRLLVQSPVTLTHPHGSNPPPAPTLNPISPNYAKSGSISLAWTISAGVTCYYSYHNINSITSVENFPADWNFDCFFVVFVIKITVQN